VTETRADYDPSRVMLNGAAIGLVTNLVNGMETRLREEIVASEKRLVRKLEDVNGDVDGLEEWRQSVEDAKQRRAGQWSVLTNAIAFVERHRALIISAALVSLPILARLLGIEISIGS
jgi:hypothetical protein